MQIPNLTILACVLFAVRASCQSTVPLVVNVPTGTTNQTVAAGNDPRLGNVLYDYGVAANNAITDRVANLTASASTYDIFSAGDFSHGSYFTRNTALWAADLDLTCFSPWNSTGLNTQAGTLITPKHVLLASHFSDPGYVINTVAISNGGTGYTSPPTVTFSGGGAMYQPPASIQAVISGGSVTGVAATGGGYGYTSPPTITFSGGGGSGAMASCTIKQAGSSPMFPGGTVMKFVDNNNVVYTRTLTAFYKVPPAATGAISTDALIGTLDSPLPQSVSCAHVIPSEADNVNYFPAGTPVAYSNQLKELHVASSNGIPGAGFSYITTGILAPWCTPTISGDSASPVFLYVNGNWDLLFCITGPGYGPDVSSLTNNINAYIAPYALTVDTVKPSGSLANVNPHGYYNSVSSLPASQLSGTNTQPAGTLPIVVPIKANVLTTLTPTPSVTAVNSGMPLYEGPWGYEVAEHSTNGQTGVPSPQGMSSVSAAFTLNATNYNAVSVAGVSGQTYDFYRTSITLLSPLTTGYIGSATVSGGVATVNDIGQSATGSVPGATNNSGVILADNAIHWISPKTGNYTPRLGEGVPVDTTSGAVIITLPAAPPDGAAVDVKWIAGTNAVTVACGGSDVFNKSGGSASVIVSTLNQAFHLCYATSFGGWVIQDSPAVSSLDGRYALINGTNAFAGSNAFGGSGFSVLPASVGSGGLGTGVTIAGGMYTGGDSGGTGGLVTIAGGAGHSPTTILTIGGSVAINGGAGALQNGNVNIGASNTAAVALGASGTSVQMMGKLNLKSYTVSTLPAGMLGDVAYVTVALSPTFLGSLTSGGSVKTPVFYNGTAWVAY